MFYPTGHHDKRLKAYVILDIFGIVKSSPPYTLKTCAGVSEVTGSRASNFIVESTDGRFSSAFAYAYWTWHAPQQSK